MRFFVGGTAKISIQTAEQYNDGRFHTIVASREAANGTLLVGEERLTESLVTDMKDLNVREGDHFIAGVPESFETRQ